MTQSPAIISRDATEYTINERTGKMVREGAHPISGWDAVIRAAVGCGYFAGLEITLEGRRAKINADRNITERILLNQAAA